MPVVSLTRLAGCLTCLALLSACGDGTGPARQVPVAAKVVPAHSGTLIDTIGAVLDGVAVVVTDSAGQPVPGATVDWRADQGRATPAASTTDASGVAKTTWTLGDGAGPQSLTASVARQASAQIRAGAIAGRPATLEISEDSLLIGVVGDAQSVRVSIRDRAKNEIHPSVDWSVRPAGQLLVQRLGTAPDSFVIRARGAGRTYALAQAGAARDSVLVNVPAWSFVTTESERTCAVTPAGAPYCWGNNFAGALGDGTNLSRPAPARVSVAGAFSRISIGRYNACGLTTLGAAHCWGLNANGEVGAGDTQLHHLTPRPVAGGHTFATLSTGPGTTCALTPAGEAFCWGANYQGELGRDTLTTCGGTAVPRCSSVPIAVSGGLRFTGMSVGENNHVCGVTASGQAWCWGQNAFSQLATSVAPDVCAFGLPCVRSPVRVETDAAFTAIAAGFNYTCALDAGGRPWCWGRGFGTRPAPVPGGFVFTDIDAGARGVCGRTAAGAVYCWGNTLGSTPVARAWEQPVQSLSVGEGLGGTTYLRICGTLAGGGAQCWPAGSS